MAPASVPEASPYSSRLTASLISSKGTSSAFQAKAAPYSMPGTVRRGSLMWP